jgi:hypothetical protein
MKTELGWVNGQLLIPYASSVLIGSRVEAASAVDLCMEFVSTNRVQQRRREELMAYLWSKRASLSKLVLLKLPQEWPSL